MKIVILVTWGNTFGKRGVYNRQEVGLARGLASLGHDVLILKAVRAGEEPMVEQLGDHCILRDITTQMIGNNGMFRGEYLRHLAEFKPDALVMFADLQMCVTAVSRWCKRNGVFYLPYVGSIITHKRGRKAVEAFSRFRNLKVYRSGPILAKTDAIAAELRAQGVTDIQVLPVGLDTTELRSPTAQSRVEAKTSLGFEDGPIVGFVGRMEPDKHPLLLPGILADLRKIGPWQMAILGDGHMANEVERGFQELNLIPYMKRINSMPNPETWKLYCASDVVINTNPGEVFGMCVLESLYYGTPVVAVEAPGPRTILRNGIDGYLAAYQAADIAKYVNKAYDERAQMGIAGQERIASSFSWQARGRIIEDLIKKRQLRASP